ncbi:hypothetical protein [Arthrobacter rhizosphaerae]|uniref:hypothetical protein n=1 Tax=Arthrobacter rhizosphaerae TaxID=2855490 RepID=UPI001FF41A2E|nr:hypothetical protein [Arthrobacter rhizosphaerae]
MALEPQIIARLGSIREHLGKLEESNRKLIALGEERLEVERRQLEAQDTQNLLGWMQLQQVAGRDPDPSLMDIVRQRLRL